MMKNLLGGRCPSTSSASENFSAVPVRYFQSPSNEDQKDLQECRALAYKHISLLLYRAAHIRSCTCLRTVCIPQSTQKFFRVPTLLFFTSKFSTAPLLLSSGKRNILNPSNRSRVCSISVLVLSQSKSASKIIRTFDAYIQGIFNFVFNTVFFQIILSFCLLDVKNFIGIAQIFNIRL